MDGGKAFAISGNVFRQYRRFAGRNIRPFHIDRGLFPHQPRLNKLANSSDIHWNSLLDSAGNGSGSIVSYPRWWTNDRRFLYGYRLCHFPAYKPGQDCICCGLGDTYHAYKTVRRHAGRSMLFHTIYECNGPTHRPLYKDKAIWTNGESECRLKISGKKLIPLSSLPQ